MKKSTTILLTLVGSIVFSLACFCGSEEKSETPPSTSGWSVDRSEKAPEATQPSGAEAPAAPEATDEVVEGGTFNAAFPDDGIMQTKRIFKQEKPGYSEAIYEANGEELVKISISDTQNNPSARDKFSTASERLGESPMMTRGKNSSLMLVSERYQVQVASQKLSPEERQKWLEAVKTSALPR